MSAVTRFKPTPMQLVALAFGPVALALGVYGVFRLVGVAVAIWQLWLLFFAIFAAFVVTASLRGGDDRLPRSRVVKPQVADRRPFAAAVRWEDRLGWSDTDAERFNNTVRKRIVPVVAERLWLAHRVDFHADPDRARALLPEQLFGLVTAPVSAPLTESEMDVIVSQIEAI
ncbi:hypothetical protein [Stackebrandtia nassauensis]|uniref:Uncharacterized protein n=1 Tax=Stackebrandtia nassauensis (strain DSM 44728 / CIP 108903 / NRRL B-16338 / NBRC 102104 / LLR-40K-21) TaxID=446470 RepID=D3PWD4_STANL|nr:hypothetical protein [Stackebrandtia nassauensis]ADD41291.1 hypothetical protein Snas_1588 [Stackebrandtia nassauensis DSM 44728]